jgi:molybdenum cofactor biosynthesis enzyme
VSKHRDRPYRSSRQKYWIEVKNRKHEAFQRVLESHRQVALICRGATEMRRGPFLNQADHAVATGTDQTLNFIMLCHGLSTGKLTIKTA